MYCCPARETCSVQVDPSQYLSSKRPAGSAYHPAGTAGAGAGLYAPAAGAYDCWSAIGAIPDDDPDEDEPDDDEPDEDDPGAEPHPAGSVTRGGSEDDGEV